MGAPLSRMCATCVPLTRSSLCETNSYMPMRTSVFVSPFFLLSPFFSPCVEASPKPIAMSFVEPACLSVSGCLPF